MNSAGNIATKQVETTATGVAMTSSSHNTLNQITAIGGSRGVKTVIVRGNTQEIAVVWKAWRFGSWARMWTGACLCAIGILWCFGIFVVSI